MQGWTEKDKFSDMVIRSQFSPTRHKKPMTPGGRRKWSNKLPRYLIISGGGGFGQSCGLSFTDSITGHRRRQYLPQGSVLGTDQFKQVGRRSSADSQKMIVEPVTPERRIQKGNFKYAKSYRNSLTRISWDQCQMDEIMTAQPPYKADIDQLRSKTIIVRKTNRAKSTKGTQDNFAISPWMQNINNIFPFNPSFIIKIFASYIMESRSPKRILVYLNMPHILNLQQPTERSEAFPPTTQSQDTRLRKTPMTSIIKNMKQQSTSIEIPDFVNTLDSPKSPQSYSTFQKRRQNHVSNNIRNAERLRRVLSRNYLPKPPARKLRILKSAVGSPRLRISDIRQRYSVSRPGGSSRNVSPGTRYYKEIQTVHKRHGTSRRSQRIRRVDICIPSYGGEFK